MGKIMGSNLGQEHGRRMLWLVLGRQGYVCNTVQREICSELIFKPQEYHDEHTIDLAILVCLLLQ